MKVKWHTDEIAWNLVIGCLNYGYLDFIKECEVNSSQYILDWGGGKGWMASKIKERARDKIVINLDPDINQLKSNPKEIHCIRAVGQKLPFKDGKFAGVHVRAALHHCYTDVEICLDEIYRILNDGGIIFIQEPLAINPLNRIARKLFSTEKHDPQERPFDPDELLKVISSRFQIIKVRYYYIFSYLLPHIISRMPLKRVWRIFTPLLLKFDQYLLENLQFTRKYAGYIEILGKKVRK
uniref:Class I SAM-dependent methyltransferase n=1 Tax=Geoglobus ahangari TaxID=113653 RepID=A0A7C3UHF8_9EURY